MTGPKKAFKDAGAPLSNVRNNWSAMAPDHSFIVITIWDHEFEKFSSALPLLGDARPGAWRYFRNTAEYIVEWNQTRVAAKRSPIDSCIGWRLLKEHLAIASSRNLPVRAVFVHSKQARKPDGSEPAECESADFKEAWRMEITYLDVATGAYELAIFPA